MIRTMILAAVLAGCTAGKPMDWPRGDSDRAVSSCLGGCTAVAGGVTISGP